MSRSTHMLRAGRMRGPGKRFVAELILWLVWVPASIVMLFLVLENFLLSDALF